MLLFFPLTIFLIVRQRQISMLFAFQTSMTFQCKQMKTDRMDKKKKKIIKNKTRRKRKRTDLSTLCVSFDAFNSSFVFIFLPFSLGKEKKNSNLTLMKMESNGKRENALAECKKKKNHTNIQKKQNEKLETMNTSNLLRLYCKANDSNFKSLSQINMLVPLNI